MAISVQVGKDSEGAGFGRCVKKQSPRLQEKDGKGLSLSHECGILDTVTKNTSRPRPDVNPGHDL